MLPRSLKSALKILNSRETNRAIQAHLSGLIEEDPAELPVVARLERPLLQQEEQRKRYLGEDGGAPPVHEDLSEICVYFRNILKITITCVPTAHQIPDVEKDVSAEDAGERLGDPLPQVDLDVGKVRQVALLPVPLRFL